MGRVKKSPDPVLLQSVLDQQIDKLQTTSLDISFNELLDMHLNGELDISPDYQRLFQWSEGARSRFIESLLLEMPIPPIYVIEDQDGRYILIDGLQRLSSYLHFRGHLTATHFKPPIKPGDFLTLCDCDIVPELDGLTFDSLSAGLKIKLKRSWVRVEIVRKGSNPKFKYHMFKRLNTGGELLTNQQLRNCTVRLLDPRFNDFIIQMAQFPPYRVCISTITDQQWMGGFDQELVLRFFSFKNHLAKYVHNVADFLTEYMELVSDPDIAMPFDFVVEQRTFEKTFRLLELALGDKAFAYQNNSKTGLVSGFSVYHYEAITLGILSAVEHLDPAKELDVAWLKERLLAIKLDPKFTAITTGGGRNARSKLEGRIRMVSQALRPE